MANVFKPCLGHYYNVYVKLPSFFTISISPKIKNYKLDEIHLLRETHKEWEDCYVFTFTEKWHHENYVYLPREFTRVTAATVYIASGTNARINANEPLGELHKVISVLLNKHRDSSVVGEILTTPF